MEMLEKNEIRKQIKEKRQALSPVTESQWNKLLTEKILDLPEIRQAFCIYCYVSFHHEAGTGQIIEALLEQGKLVAVPRVFKRELEFYTISGSQELEEGAMGIMEPKTSCLRVCDPYAPVLVPGLAFDLKGARIGYGGGYYDRFFEREPEHLRLALAYEFQLFDSLPSKPHDKAMNQIITP